MRKPITKKGYEELQKRLELLEKVDRPKIVQDIVEARAHGDIKENAEYHSAKEKQSFIEGRINELRGALSSSQIIDTKGLDSESVIFGATVDLINVDSGEKRVYTLVGEYETDIERGLISINSPIARALLKREIGEVVKVNAPGGIFEYEIKNIYFGE
ncbi:MAG: transcription elongation factor GreA [Candidatus Schekmanbacteria bacterium]|nr:transcription elongation factor GreA [Candidatus Schekmanbacteria bacterium]